ETWSHLNVFYNRLLKLQPRDLALSRLSQLCQSVKEDCQLHTGIIEGTGYRDQAWYIYQIGKYLERMDQTTRLLDINYHRLLELQPRDLALSRLSKLCQTVKEDCQLHTGIIEGTGYRDQAWYIYQIGKYLERMDQTTRLLDINYHRLLPSLQQVGTEIDASRWNAVLRSVAAYHAFRRMHPRGMSPTTVAGFLLFDRSFQRSVAVCIETVDEMFTRLASLAALSDIGPAAQTLATLRTIGKETSIEQVIMTGLHEFLDHLQQLIIALCDELGDALFGHRYERATASQHQS
ncbi:MAG: alpha-E domain-containing protein, partial [Geminicoccaceae bacterium]